MNVDQVYEDLAQLRERLPLVGEFLEPGTPRRWSQRDMTDDERAQMDARALSERAARLALDRAGIVVVGETRPPLRVSVLDQLVQIHAGIREVESCACEWLGLTALAGATTRERIDRIVGLLDRIAALDELAMWVASEAARLNRVARRACGDAEPVHKIDAPCLLCGMYSLRAFPERGLIACMYSECQCGSATCRCYKAPRPGIHKWDETRWKQLARDLDMRAAQAKPKTEAS